MARALPASLAAAAVWWAATAGAGLAGLAAPRWALLGAGAAALLALARWLDGGLLAGWRAPRWGGVPRGIVVGVALLMAGGISGWSPDLGIGWAAVARWRTMEALAPGWSPLVAVAVACAHELLFRGALLARLGPVGATLAWTLAATPLDPARGLSTGAVLAVLSRRCGVEAALAAHLAWALAPASLSMGFSPALALGVTALAGALAAAPAGPAPLGFLGADRDRRGAPEG